MIYRPTRYELMMKASDDLDIRARRMFNGMGIYAGECMFAFLTGDDIGLKLSQEDIDSLSQMSKVEAFRASPESEPMNEYVKIPHTVLEDFERFSVLVHQSAEYAQSKSTVCVMHEPIV